jgi:hypothetical protein
MLTARSAMLKFLGVFYAGFVPIWCSPREKTSMKIRVSAVAIKTSELLKSFIVMAMKTMFRGGASGGQIRSLLSTYMPDQQSIYGGQRVLLALEDLERDGTLERRGIRWCLTSI